MFTHTKSIVYPYFFHLWNKNVFHSNIGSFCYWLYSGFADLRLGKGLKVACSLDIPRNPTSAVKVKRLYEIIGHCVTSIPPLRLLFCFAEIKEHKCKKREQHNNNNVHDKLQSIFVINEVSLPKVIFESFV